MTGYYLIDNPNPGATVNPDGTYWGYQVMRGDPYLVTVHTSESFADLIAPDTGAEAVAGYFTRSTTPASYHTLVDSDGLVRCLPAGLDDLPVHTAFHCYGRNTGNLGISFAMRATEWATVPDWWATAALEHAADEVAAWCRRWDIPLRRVTLAEVDAGVPGITGHGIVQPEDRSDPGLATVFQPSLFPWDEFFELVSERLDGGVSQPEGEEFELRACEMNDGQILLVDGMEYKVLTEAGRPWDEINAILVELGRTGLIPTGEGGVPVIEKIGDNAVNALRKVN